jgi:hypothetical protein
VELAHSSRHVDCVAAGVFRSCSFTAMIHSKVGRLKANNVLWVRAVTKQLGLLTAQDEVDNMRLHNQHNRPLMFSGVDLSLLPL